MCNFGMKDKKRCSLAIQINDIAYDVKGTGIDDHGDSHAKEGFCNAIRVANVKGEIKKNTLKAESFCSSEKLIFFILNSIQIGICYTFFLFFLK